MKQKNQLFEKINKIDRQREKRRQFTIIKNSIRNKDTNSANIKRVREYYEQLHTHKFTTNFLKIENDQNSL